MMTPAKRNYFDKQVEWVLAQMPKKIVRLLKEIPLHVEDYPSRWVRKETGIKNPYQILGYFTGVPLDTILRRSGTGSPTHILIYRSGIFEASRSDEGHICLETLRRQIQTTILHELGHYHGMDEYELEELGYG